MSSAASSRVLWCLRPLTRLPRPVAPPPETNGPGTGGPPDPPRPRRMLATCGGGFLLLEPRAKRGLGPSWRGRLARAIVRGLDVHPGERIECTLHVRIDSSAPKGRKIAPVRIFHHRAHYQRFELLHGLGAKNSSHHRPEHVPLVPYPSLGLVS